ncbi:MAG: PP2C family protein-serine/threonine phosphatase [Candidatus Acidiferrales bacterium]
MTKRNRATADASAVRAESALVGAVAALSDMGQNRKNNEDNLVIYDFLKKSTVTPGAEAHLPTAPPGVLLAVADGMGGHSSGQVASQLCVDNLPRAVEQLVSGGETSAEKMSAALRRAVEVTNEAIFQAAKKSHEFEGMGTTLTAVWLAGGQALIAQVGDSRAYLLHQGKLTQLTQDQTVLNSVSEAEREALANTPFENMLLQAVGAMAQLDVPITSHELVPDDLLLLCSDGLYKVLNNAKLGELLSRPDSLESKAQTLINETNAGGGPDNVTVILCRIQKGGGEQAE